MTHCPTDSHHTYQHFALSEFTLLVTRPQLTADGQHWIGKCPQCPAILAIPVPPELPEVRTWTL